MKEQLIGFAFCSVGSGIDLDLSQPFLIKFVQKNIMLLFMLTLLIAKVNIA